MPPQFQPLSPDVLAKRYGAFFIRRTHPLDVESVPTPLRPIVAYAEIWGVSDDYDRERMADGAPDIAKADLIALIDRYNSDLDEWLAGPESYSETPSREYLAFSNMRMAHDHLI